MVERLVLNHRLLEGRVSDVTGEVRVVQRVQNELHQHAVGLNQAIATMGMEQETAHAGIQGQILKLQGDVESVHVARANENEEQGVDEGVDGAFFERLVQKSKGLDDPTTAVNQGNGRKSKPLGAPRTGVDQGKGGLLALKELLDEHRQSVKADIWDAMSAMEQKFEGLLQQKMEKLEQTIETAILTRDLADKARPTMDSKNAYASSGVAGNAPNVTHCQVHAPRPDMTSVSNLYRKGIAV